MTPDLGPRSHHATVTAEFRRAAEGFDRRTQGRFDNLGVLELATPKPTDSVLEVGVGTGRFLGLFEGVAARLVGVDLTPEMLVRARAAHPRMLLARADGARLPLASKSIDLVVTAQTLHHVVEPIRFLEEMVRVMAPEGRLLIVDQVAPEKFEAAVAMNEFELVRDPSHAASRPASALRTMVRAVGLEPVAEKIVEIDERLSEWMLPGEFPGERIEAVCAFLERRAEETGMSWRHDGREWVFTRWRMMLLAVPLRRP